MRVVIIGYMLYMAIADMVFDAINQTEYGATSLGR